MSKILVIGDCHIPFTINGYLEHCARTRDRFRCDRIIHIGDLTDNHATSFHTHDPDCSSAGDELRSVRPEIDLWHREFPEMDVLEGNHDALPRRKAVDAGIAAAWIKSYQEVYRTPRWRWHYETEVDGVKFIHDPGAGNLAAIALKHRQSVVAGHHHSKSGISYNASSRDLIFGMFVGCGVDREARAMAYGKGFTDKPIISCAVVLDGVPQVIPMDLGSRYPATRRKLTIRKTTCRGISGK